MESSSDCVCGCLSISESHSLLEEPFTGWWWLVVLQTSWHDRDYNVRKYGAVAEKHTITEEPNFFTLINSISLSLWWVLSSFVSSILLNSCGLPGVHIKGLYICIRWSFVFELMDLKGLKPPSEIRNKVEKISIQITLLLLYSWRLKSISE